jgi:hypothetical protein
VRLGAGHHRADLAPAQHEAAIDQLLNGLAHCRARQAEPFGQSDLVFARVYGHEALYLSSCI